VTRKNLALLLITVLVLDAIIVGAIVGATSKSPGAGLGIGLLALVLPLALISGIMRIIVHTTGWRTLQRRYPCEDPAVFERGAKIISLAIRSPAMNLNNCVEAKSDDAHLHLRIAFPFSGDPDGMSIPWEAITSLEPASFGRVRARVDGISWWFPKRLVARELELREAIERGQDARAPEDAPAGTIDA
jgi:hypothetical protein